MAINAGLCNRLSPAYENVDQNAGSYELIAGQLCDSTHACMPAALYRGYIPSDFEQRFELLERELAKAGHGQHRWICLHSRGGSSVQGALVAARLHKARLNTCVVPIKKDKEPAEAPLCASACTDLFMAGEQRIVEKGAAVGFHRASTANFSAWCWAPNCALAGAQKYLLQPLYRWYSGDDRPARHQADAAATATAPEHIHWLDEHELNAWARAGRLSQYAGWTWQPIEPPK